MMTDSYGAAWTKSKGIIPPEHNGWAAFLHGLTEKDIEKGLFVLSESGREYPPSSTAFRKMCVDKTKDELLADSRARSNPSNHLSHIPATREANRKAASAAKQAFGRQGFTENMEKTFQEIFRGDK